MSATHISSTTTSHHSTVTMPTYVVYAPTLSSETKQALARAIASRHSEITGAPKWFAQVVFPTSERYVGGARVEDGHIWVRGDIRSGRDVTTRSKLAEAIARDVATITGFQLESCWVYITSVDASDIVEYGRVMPHPGEEEAWFQSMDPQVRSAGEALFGKDVYGM